MQHQTHVNNIAPCQGCINTFLTRQRMIKLNTTQKFRFLHIVNHIVAISAIVIAIQTSAYWWFLLGLLAFLWTGIVGVNVALHRYYSHRAFTTTPFREKILLFSSIVTSLGSPAMWCSVHRLHHVTSDTDKIHTILLEVQ